MSFCYSVPQGQNNRCGYVAPTHPFAAPTQGKLKSSCATEQSELDLLPDAERNLSKLVLYFTQIIKHLPSEMEKPSEGHQELRPAYLNLLALPRWTYQPVSDITDAPCNSHRSPKNPTTQGKAVPACRKGTGKAKERR